MKMNSDHLKRKKLREMMNPMKRIGMTVNICGELRKNKNE
jgi:hypothetical protein